MKVRKIEHRDARTALEATVVSCTKLRSDLTTQNIASVPGPQ